MPLKGGGGGGEEGEDGEECTSSSSLHGWDCIVKKLMNQQLKRQAIQLMKQWMCRDDGCTM